MTTARQLNAILLTLDQALRFIATTFPSDPHRPFTCVVVGRCEAASFVLRFPHPCFFFLPFARLSLHSYPVIVFDAFEELTDDLMVKPAGDAAKKKAQVLPLVVRLSFVCCALWIRVEPLCCFTLLTCVLAFRTRSAC